MDYLLCKAAYYGGLVGGIAFGLEVARRLGGGLLAVAAAFACIIAGAAVSYAGGKIADEIYRERGRKRRGRSE
jgi:hypothetical protein